MGLQYGDEPIEEVILDEDPMAMSNDLDIDSNEAELVHSEKTLDQQQQSLLLGDDTFRQKMVDDALNRRQQGGDSIKSAPKRKIPRSAWEEEDHDSTPTLSGGSGSNTMSPEDEEQRSKKRKGKRITMNFMPSKHLELNKQHLRVTIIMQRT